MAKTKSKSHRKQGSIADAGGHLAATPESRPVVAPTGGLIAFLQQLSNSRAIFLLGLVSFLAYANSLGGEFVFDDTEQIVENQSIRSWNNLTKAFTTHVWEFRDKPETLDVPPPLPYYRPLFTMMLTVEYQLFGLWPQGWHLVSLLLHVLCAAGVFYVILLASGRRLTALLASLLFAIHPVHAESVSWISGMTDPLFGVFFLASLYAYLKYRTLEESGRASHRVLAFSLALFAVSTFAKETALSLVPLIFGFELIKASGPASKRLIGAAKRALPFCAVALFYLVPRLLVLGELMWKNPQAPDRPLVNTLLTLPVVVCSYIAHLVWPMVLSVTYNTHFVTSITSPGFLLPGAALAFAIGALFLYRDRASADVWQALLLIFVPLLPVLNLGQVSREEYLVFDHYLYLPVAGFAYLVAIVISKLGAFEDRRAEMLGAMVRRSQIAIGVFTIVALSLTVAAARENRSWADSYALWSNVARVNPDYWAGHYNSGLALLNAKRFEEARISLERATALKPDEANVIDAIGRAFDGMGDVSNAVKSFRLAIAINPEIFESYNNLGTVYFKNEDYALARAEFTTALRLKPQATASRFNLGLCYAREGRYSDAAREFDRVVQTTPDDADAFYQLGLVFEKMGRAVDALHALERGRALAKSQELTDRISDSLSRLRDENHTP
ncbi:MAG: tetratricopeptide repeat protein [Blastocatellia bacterium]